ncbi:tRNA 2-selenouridine(34) synthase MnmH [Paenibacillus lutrae]|uniref:tRNA 2-selenouridine(34) synthase MnmH n=1 Tax=Paenibacillus lutrae TaxID=2078573 RepID=A0A7X3FF25_9BACL|nr:tRNA 2-selenouridine(34) synthase MnmH [Paenibacillus lutrae]MVO98454.1 tRNA 2-selenouridine(34) synthase MnmH [Paenibacillus lutrae]
MFRDITVEQLLELQEQRGIQLIDVRSEGEFEEFTVPGSMNIPVFNNEERKEVGTIYKQISVQAAKERGLEIFSAKLPAFMKQFEAIPGQKAVFCWRGGMRSKTAATVTSLMGMQVYRLQGGIRSYRKWTVEQLGHFDFKPVCVVIGGPTGTGKTHLLQRLDEAGYPVIDLEKMAQHRGSIFGQIGLKPNNQKAFESHLIHKLQEVNAQPFVLIEAESKRVGKAVMPDFLYQAKEQGIPLFIDVPIAERVRHIVEDYEPELHKEECVDAFGLIEKRIHSPIAADISRYLAADEFGKAVELMLENYYDSRYEHAAQSYTQETVTLKAENEEQAFRLIVEELQKRFPEYRPEPKAALSGAE